MTGNYVTRQDFQIFIDSMNQKIEDLKRLQKSNALKKKLLSKDMGKFTNVEKSETWNKDFRELQRIEREKERSNLENFFGWNEPAQVPSALDILKGKKSMAEFKKEQEKAEAKALKEVLKG